ncbi:MAG: hypothetical protein FJ276_20000 [Planctomycetes bacterium]|nr:hypothetical protein [Planctomycetota bacterium]
MPCDLHDPPLSESDTRSKLIDPAIHARGWTEEHVRREETAGAVEKDGPIQALRELGKPADVLLGTKARLFAA